MLFSSQIRPISSDNKIGGVKIFLTQFCSGFILISTNVISSTEEKLVKLRCVLSLDGHVSCGRKGFLSLIFLNANSSLEKKKNVLGTINLIFSEHLLREQ